jgi:RNA polymerase sigma-70 factor, ECF subfamily
MAIRADEIDLTRDRLLVEAWQAGDAAAFDDLYRRYFDRLRAFCQRRVGDRAEAEELAQEAFVKALQALPRFDGERKFYPWMTVIASRLCIDHHRRHRRVEPSPDIDLGVIEDGHDDRLSHRVDLEHLHEAMSQLGPRHLEVLDLRERRELSYEQIAGELGVPNSTVEALLFRARRALPEFHRVSADRLAGVPVLGWLIERSIRTRNRLALIGADFGALGGSIAAGAVTAVLIGLPAPHAAPISVVSQNRLAAAPAAVSTVPAAPEPESAAAPDLPPASPRAASPTVQTKSGQDAAREASDMPLHLDLAQTGVGVDPTPLVSAVFAPSEGNQP